MSIRSVHWRFILNEDRLAGHFVRQNGAMASICKSLGTDLGQKSFPVFVLMGYPCNRIDSPHKHHRVTLGEPVYTLHAT